MKTWLKITLGIIGLFVVLGIIGSIANSSDSKETGNLIQEQESIIESNQEECIPNWQCSSWSECSPSEIQTRYCDDVNDCSANTNKPVESQTCDYQSRLGDRVIVGDLAYTIHSKTEISEVGEYYGYGDYETFFGEKADGIFYVFDITIENVGRESITFWQTNIKIYDIEGRTFDPDTIAYIYLDNSFGYDQLQPGLPKRGKFVFDVPQGLKGKLEISDTNLLSTQKKYILWE